jgi:glycyl-tRNA synthetase
MNTFGMEHIINLCKRRGFLFQGSEIYGGLAGTFDYGPLGVALKNNIKQLWWKQFVTDRTDMYGVDAAILMNQKVWQASGHVGGFSDPLIEDLVTKKRYRADHLLEEKGIDPRGMTIDEMSTLIKEKGIQSPEGNALGDVRQFNMMFKTTVGAIESDESISYLRPETAQGMFVNFKNILDTFHPKLPFGMAQIGKAFRNEIAPRDFIFRVREFEQMEIEYFVDPRNEALVNETFDALFEEQMTFLKTLGLSQEKIHKIEVPAADRAHYSKRSVDTEYDFLFGQKELLGLAYRTDYDLKAHTTASGVDLSYFDEETKERFIPHCIEPTFGLDRLVLATLSEAYRTDGEGDSERIYLALPPALAPITVCVSPLLKNKPELVAKAQEVFTMLKKSIGTVAWDDNGNIGKRYRRHDEIGTPFCVVVDFDTLGEHPEHTDTVTIRHRDTGQQERIAISNLESFIKSKL